jgi:hypothetical protein
VSLYLAAERLQSKQRRLQVKPARTDSRMTSQAVDAGSKVPSDAHAHGRHRTGLPNRICPSAMTARCYRSLRARIHSYSEARIVENLASHFKIQLERSVLTSSIRL